MKKLLVTCFLVSAVLLSFQSVFSSCNNDERNETEMPDPIKGSCITVEVYDISDGLVSSWAIGLEKDWHIRFNASDLKDLSFNVGDTIDIKIVEYERDFVQLGYRGPYITCEKVTSCQ